jgi:uncharacterized protein (UPF0548 family)
MFLLTRPSPDLIRDFLTSLQHSAFSYPEGGATNTAVPVGYICDHNRIVLGQGDATWEKAVAAILGWTMFDLGWTEIFPQNSPLTPGTNVAVLIRHLGFFSLNASRIVYVIDEPNRFGFAYGTLHEHAEMGEERFLVERDKSGGICYDLLAFSRPRHALAKIGYPMARRLQKRFAADSKKRMMRAVVEEP